QKYSALTQDMYAINNKQVPIMEVDDFYVYKKTEELALSSDEEKYKNGLSTNNIPKLTDSPIFDSSQKISEHSRHKIFNGTFVIDGEEQPSSLFKLIKKTSETHPNDIISAYKDNVAFVKGPKITQFAPKSADKPDFYEEKAFESV